jgi:hypothetical protein
MIQVNILELALHDPSRLTADLAGRTRLEANAPHAPHTLRRAPRLIRRRRPTAER